MSEPSDKAMVGAAHRLHHRDGEIEIDTHDSPMPTARVSRGSYPGAYVMAWIWVKDGDVLPEDEK